MKKPIRIAQVMGKWVGGGVEAVVMNYYRNIDKTKVQFDFIFDDDSNDIPYDEIKELGGKVILIPPYQKVIKYHKELKRVLKEGNYKIVHSHINVLSVFSLYAAKKANIPVRIAHSHSTTNKSEKKKNLLKQVLRPFSKIFATHYFACTEHAGVWMFGEKEDIYILNNAIDLEQFKYSKKSRNEIRKEFNINEDTLVIGHIGRFVNVKNHDFILDLFKNLQDKEPNSVLLLVGQGQLMDKIKEKTKELNLEDKVIFAGQRNDINKFYQAFDVFLFPSLYEGFGMVLIEAQTSGLYSIASKFVPSIAKATENVEFLDLNDPLDKWTNIILDNRNNKRKNYIEQIKRHGYDITTEAKKLEDKYLELNK